jgi:hypothetical protein
MKRPLEIHPKKRPTMFNSEIKVDGPTLEFN